MQSNRRAPRGTSYPRQQQQQTVRLDTFVPDIGDEHQKIVLVINDVWFELDKRMVDHWSPFLLREVRMHVKERKEQENDGSVMASFYPEPPIFVNIDTCQPDYSYIDKEMSASTTAMTPPTTTENTGTIIRSGSGGRSTARGSVAEQIQGTGVEGGSMSNPRAQQHIPHQLNATERLRDFNVRIYELLAFQHVDFLAMQTVDELMKYTVIVCMSGLDFDGMEWLSHLNQMIYPKDLYDAVDIVQTFLPCLTQHGRLDAKTLELWINDVVRQNVPYFGARFELLRQLERIRRRYPTTYDQLIAVFDDALIQTYPQCAERARTSAASVLQQLRRVRNVDGGDNRFMPSMILYQNLFIPLDAEDCLPHTPRHASTASLSSSTPRSTQSASPSKSSGGSSATNTTRKSVASSLKRFFGK